MTLLRYYCASCEEQFTTKELLYLNDNNQLLHNVCEGTAACGPVLKRY